MPRSATIGELGGSTVRGKEPVGDMGFAAYFTDSEGNLVGLWQNASRAEPYRRPAKRSSSGIDVSTWLVTSW